MGYTTQFEGKFDLDRPADAITPRVASVKPKANVPAQHLACFGAAAKYVKTHVSHDLEEMRESVARGRKVRYAELMKERGFETDVRMTKDGGVTYLLSCE